MAANPTPHEYTKNLRPNIRLSTWEHQDFIDAINDDRLSAPALMKFKELYRVTSLQNIIVPIVSLVPAYFASRWSVGTFTFIQDSSTGAWLQPGSPIWGWSSSTPSSSTWASTQRSPARTTLT